MRSKGFDGMDCSMAEVMAAVGDRWGALIMRDLLLGLTRYDDLRLSSGITNATLSDRLKALEQAELIARRQYQSRPDRYDYIPTDKGRDLALLMQAMVQIGDKWRRGDGRQPPLRFIDAQSDRSMKLGLVDEQTGEPVRAPVIAIRAGRGADDAMRRRIALGEEERAVRSRGAAGAGELDNFGRAL